jgi:catechol 2,3-dioxygenase
MTNTLRLSQLSLRVADLQRSVDFYAGSLGFVVQASTGPVARLGVDARGPDCLELREHRGARPAAPGATGLFHGALLLPNRRALGAWLGFAASRGVGFDGFADHGVSEALYLADPDGNGLEFYADRPRDQWPWAGGELAMYTRPLDVRELIATGGQAGEQPLANASWGHLHLRVADLGAATRFYERELRIAVTQGSFPGACFLAADGYHHHLGLNAWGGPQRAPFPDEAGLGEARWWQANETVPRHTLVPEGFSLVMGPLADPS